MNVLLDMNISPRLGEYLRSSGVDAVHWLELGGEPSADDRLIVERAAKEGLVIITHDLDFGAILAQAGLEVPSVIQIRDDDLSVEALGATLRSVLVDLEGELRSGALVTLDSEHTRIRILPIRR